MGPKCFLTFDTLGRATLQDWSLTLYGTSTPAAKNDPIPFRNPIIRNRSNATRPVVVQTGRKNNRGKSVPIVQTYTVGLVKRKKNKNSKNPNRNSQKKQGRPATRSPIESTTSRLTTSTTPDLSLNLRGDLTDPLSDVRGRKMSNLFEQYPKIQRIYPAPLQANGTCMLSVDTFCVLLNLRIVCACTRFSFVPEFCMSCVCVFNFISSQNLFDNVSLN